MFDIYKSDVYSLGLVFLYLLTLSDINGLNTGEADTYNKIHKKIAGIQ